eukprot:GAHX01000765.1.p1 GENE.GAHX01000765.1~~GAHX01000765.1.p1  ORF type:complete len:487 (-),score=49.60 GAHX01000765.1:355-1815(-)
MEDTSSLQITYLLLILLPVVILSRLIKNQTRVKSITKLSTNSISLLLSCIIGVIKYFTSKTLLNLSADAVFIYLLPIILVQCSLFIKKEQLIRKIFSVLCFSILATLVAFFIVLVISKLSLRLVLTTTTIVTKTNQIDYFAPQVASALSAIDPVVLFGMLETSTQATKNVLAEVVFGESLINDVLEITIFKNFYSETESVEDAIKNNKERKSGLRLALSIGLVSFGSLVIGLGISILITYILRVYEGHFTLKTETLLIGLQFYLPYLIADSLNCSGIFSLLISSIFSSCYALPLLSDPTVFFIRNLFDLLSEIVENFIFVAIGIEVGERVNYLFDLKVIAATISLLAAFIVARLIASFFIGFLANCVFGNVYSITDMIFFSTCIARGVASLGMVKKMSVDKVDMHMYVSLVFVIFFSIIINEIGNIIMSKRTRRSKQRIRKTVHEGVILEKIINFIDDKCIRDTFASNYKREETENDETQTPEESI